MNEGRMRVAIAEACGWSYCDKCQNFHNPSTNEASDLPDYLNDLNACHEAWLTLNTVERAKFAEELAYVVLDCYNDPKTEFVFSRCSLSLFANSKPRERVEAFLRCKGLWKEEHEPISG